MFFGRHKKWREQDFNSIGDYIDCPFEYFKEYIRKKKVPIGQVSVIVTYLTNAYFDLKIRKDSLVSIYSSQRSKKEKRKIYKSLKGCYIEMLKIEQKITFLQDHKKNLLKIADTNEDNN